MLVTQTSFSEGSSGDLVKRRLFSQVLSETVFRQGRVQKGKVQAWRVASWGQHLPLHLDLSVKSLSLHHYKLVKQTTDHIGVHNNSAWKLPTEKRNTLK